MSAPDAAVPADRLYGTDSLEQRCVEPGRWRIEGFEVFRTPSGRQWVVRDVELDVLVAFPTLRAAREAIAYGIPDGAHGIGDQFGNLSPSPRPAVADGAR